MIRLLLVATLTLAVALPASAEPFWGAKASQPVDTDPSALKPGEFVWDGDAVPSGPIVVVVSLPEQRADVYRNGVRIGVTTVSTGKPGTRHADGDLHGPAERRAPPLEDLQQCGDAFCGAPDLGRRGTACRWSAWVSVLPRLRAPALRIRAPALRRSRRWA